MRLYLSSMGLGSEADRLVSMLPGNRRAAVVFSAIDMASNEERKQATINREIELLSGWGWRPRPWTCAATSDGPIRWQRRWPDSAWCGS